MNVPAMSLIDPLLKKALAIVGSEKRRALVVGGDSDVVLQSLSSASSLLRPLIVGRRAHVEARLDALGIDLADSEIVSADSEAEMAACATELLARAGIDIVVKGQIHTDVFMRALLNREAGLRGDRFCSHIFCMLSESFPHAYFLSDAALNFAPVGEVGEAILYNLAHFAALVEGSPANVALLSASETVHPKMPSTAEAERLKRWGEKNLSSAVVESVTGPIALDAAVNFEAARVKGFGADNKSAGAANALLVPSIEAGNILFKSWVHFNAAIAAGVVIGAKLPIVLTSRSDSEASRLASLALAIIAHS